SPTLCGLSERVIVSGLYWRMIAPSGIPVVGSSERMAPFRRSGDTLDISCPSAARNFLDDPAGDLACGFLGCCARAHLARVEALEGGGRIAASFARRRPLSGRHRVRQARELGAERTNEASLLRLGVARERQSPNVEAHRATGCRREARRRFPRSRRGFRDGSRYARGAVRRATHPRPCSPP